LFSAVGLVHVTLTQQYQLSSFQTSGCFNLL
jgi:hypothetical protein